MMASIQTVGLWREAEALQHQKMLYGFLGISTKKQGPMGGDIWIIHLNLNESKTGFQKAQSWS